MGFVSHEDHHHGHKVDSNQTGENSDHPAELSFGSEVTIAYSSHGDEDEPHGIPLIIPVLIQVFGMVEILPVVEFEGFDGCSETIAGDDENERQHEERVFLLKCFESKTCIRFADVFFTISQLINIYLPDVFTEGTTPPGQVLEQLQQEINSQ